MFPSVKSKRQYFACKSAQEQVNNLQFNQRSSKKTDKTSLHIQINKDHVWRKDDFNSSSTSLRRIQCTITMTKPCSESKTAKRIWKRMERLSVMASTADIQVKASRGRTTQELHRDALRGGRKGSHRGNKSKQTDVDNTIRSGVKGLATGSLFFFYPIATAGL